MLHFEAEGIGIGFYSLHIVRTLDDLDLSYVLEHCQNKESARYVILIEQKTKPDFNRLKQIFRKFWSRSVLNIIIIYWTTHLNAMSYMPFGGQFLLNINPNETRIEHLFPEKAANLFGHPMRVGLFHEPQRANFVQHGSENFTHDHMPFMKGTDGRFTKLLIKSMNATLQLIQPGDNANLGERFPNGSSNGIFAYLQNGTVDVGLNARFYRYQQFRHRIEVTVTIGRDDLCILVPRAGIASNLDNLFDSFEAPVWFLIIIALPIYSLVFHIFTKKRPQNSMPEPSSFYASTSTFVEVFVRFLGWNVNQPYKYIPNAMKIKFLLGIWIIYTAIITNWYNSTITSYLMLRPRLPDIKTLQQLEQSNYHILTNQRYVDLINEFVNSTADYPRLVGRIHAIENNEIYQRILKKDTNYAYANKEHINNFILRKGHVHNSFAAMKECPVPFINVYAVSYGSPFKGRINWILMQAQDNGLFTFWEELKAHQENILRTRHSFHRRRHNHHEPIKVYHLQTAFYIWFAGCFIGVFIFVAEIGWKIWTLPIYDTI